MTGLALALFFVSTLVFGFYSGKLAEMNRTTEWIDRLEVAWRKHMVREKEFNKKMAAHTEDQFKNAMKLADILLVETLAHRRWMKRAVKAERRLAEVRDRVPLVTDGLGAAVRMLETSRVFGKHGVPDTSLVMRAATERIVAHREGRGVP